MKNQEINIRCSCGGDKFEIPHDPTSSDIVTCQSALKIDQVSASKIDHPRPLIFFFS